MNKRKRKNSFKGGRTKKRKVKKKNSFKKKKKTMSEKKYQELIKKAKSKKRLTKRQKNSLHKELKRRYCRCLLSQKQKGKGAFAICGNSVYYNRNLKPASYPISCKRK